MNTDLMTNGGGVWDLLLVLVLIRGSDLTWSIYWSESQQKNLSCPLEKFVRKSEKPPVDALRRSFCAYFKCIKKTRQLQMNYYALKMWAIRSQCFLPKINNRHPWQFRKSKSWGPFWSYQLNSTSNLAHLAHFLGKWAGLAVMFSW